MFLFPISIPNNIVVSHRQRSVCCGQTMSAQENVRGVRCQIHQKAAQQVEPTRRGEGRHRARGEHPEGDPASKYHHPA